MALTILRIINQVTVASYEDLNELIKLEDGEGSFDPAEKQMLTDGKTKCDANVSLIFKICFDFLRFSQDDLDELDENPIDFIEQIK